MGRRLHQLIAAAGTLAAALLGDDLAIADALGAEFRVHSVTAGDQAGPAIAATGGGRVVVAWEGQGTGDTIGVFAQRFDAGGAKLGGELAVNTTTAGEQVGPAVVADPGGGFLVAWEGSGSGDAVGVFAQRYDAGGVKLGGEFRVSTTTSGDQTGPSIAPDPGGGFVVVWEGAGSGDSLGVFGQRLNADGSKLGGEFSVNTTTAGAQAGPSVTPIPGGGFVVAWEGAGPGDSAGVFGQRFDASGTKLGSEVGINSTISGNQLGPDLEDVGGGFIVVWDGAGPGDTLGLFGQRFDASFNKVGSEFRLNTFTSGIQEGAAVEAGANGSFLVVWESAAQDGSLLGVYARRFDASGNPLAAEFRVNTFTTGDQAGSDIEAGSDGNILVAWESSAQDGSGLGVYGQRYDFTPPDTSIVSGPSGGSSPSATFSFTSSESGSTFACALDASAFASCSSPKTYTGLVEGTHVFSVRATDLAGNSDATPATRTWSIDTSPPVVSMVRPSPGRLYVIDIDAGSSGGSATVVGALTVRAQGSDTGSGLASMQFLVDGVGVNPAQVVYDPATNTYSFTWHPGPIPADHTITARATNGAGLVASVSRVAFGVGL